MEKNSIRPAKVESYLSKAEAPVTAKRICEALFNSSKESAISAVEQELDRLVKEGKIFEHPALRRNTQNRYWSASPLESVKTKIIGFIRGTKNWLTVKQVKGKVPTYERGFFDEAIGQLISERKAHFLKANRTTYLLIKAPNATDYLLDRHISTLKEIVKRIAPYRKNQLTFDNLISFLNGHGPCLANDRDVDIPAELLREWYNADLINLRGAKSVPLPWTWRRYEAWFASKGAAADPSDFRKLIKNLSKEGMIELLPHSGTEAIPETERTLVIKSEQGETLYFWKWCLGGVK